MDRSTQLQGRVALVTGAARGIGRSIAVALAGAGAHVAVTSRDPAGLAATSAEIEGLGCRTLALPLELHDADAIEAAVATVVAELGQLDVVVANSGIGGPTAPLWEVSTAALDETLAVNVRGTFLTVRAGLAAMVAAGRPGSVVVIGSMTGKRPLAHRTPYAMSKAALIGLVRTAALDAGPHDLRVNLVSPGFVEGERLDWVVEAQAEAVGRDGAVVRTELASAAPLQRFVPADDVADAVVFLAGDAAASFTGADLNVSAGLVMH